MDVHVILRRVDPPEGHVVAADGAEVAFAGWLDLMGALDRACARGGAGRRVGQASPAPAPTPPRAAGGSAGSGASA